ncbi:MAG TPA: hypothetical protein VFX80_08005, partial [Solirubrobacteraceae bacterium]|nr:hypothetical protein [Solirubrobacteraceae bacterium]
MRTPVAVAAVGLVLAGCGQGAAESPSPPGDAFAVVVAGTNGGVERKARGRFVTARVVRRAALRASPGGR